MNWSAVTNGEVPLGVTTVTSTVPEPAGETAVALESLFTAMVVAAEEPNMMAVAPVKPVPLRLTVVPPAAGPEVGLMAVTLGGPGM